MQVKPLQAVAAVHPAVTSLQAPTLTTRGGYQISTPAGTDDVVVQLNNVEVLRITIGANVTIRTKGTLTLEATNIELKCSNNLSARAGSCMDLRAGLNASLNAGNDLAMAGCGTVKVNGAAVDVDGGTINLN